jgi:hypothetical protein
LVAEKTERFVAGAQSPLARAGERPAIIADIFAGCIAPLIGAATAFARLKD